MSEVRVTLIHDVHKASRSGPINGMYALQCALREKLKGGEVDWLAIADSPMWCSTALDLATM